MNRILLFGLFCCVMLNCYATTVQLFGNAPSFAERNVKVFVHQDPFTNTRQTLDETIIDSSGKFELNAIVEKITKAFIQIEEKYAIIYLDPNTTSYQFHFPASLAKNSVSKSKASGKLIFENLASDDINTLILEFNLLLDDFMYQTSVYLTMPTLQDSLFKPQFKKFKAKIDSMYSGIDKPYYQDFITFSLAPLEEVNNGRRWMYKKFIKDKPIRYNHDLYFRYLTSFYDNTLRIGTGSKSDIQNALNSNNALEEVKNIIRQGKYSDREDIIELVVIKSMMELFSNRAYSKLEVMKVLKQLRSTSTFPIHRQFATNVLDYLTKLDPGQMAPNFSYKANSKSNSLEKHAKNGKWVYLHFWASWHDASIAEFKLLERLHEKYGKHIKIVSVSVDKDKANFDRFKKLNRFYKWDIIHYNFDNQLLDDYNVAQLPTYYLIDSIGRIKESPALGPSPDGTHKTIEEIFFKIKLQNEPKRSKVGSKFN